MPCYLHNIHQFLANPFSFLTSACICICIFAIFVSYFIKLLSSFFLSTLIICCRSSSPGFGSHHLQPFEIAEALNTQSLLFRWSRKQVTTQHDSLNFPSTTPAIVTIPSATPATVTPTPAFTPTTLPPPTTVTNPAAPVTITPPAIDIPPATNPVTTPAVNPPATTNSPAAAGQRWCVAKSGAAEKSIQSALDYACGIGGADCATIQQGASCFNPNTLQNHASYAFNSYYQRNPLPPSCDFGGAAVVTTTNPSSGSCVFASSATSATPTTVAPPMMETPTTTMTPPMTVSPVTTNPAQTPIPIQTPIPTPTPTTASSTGASPLPLGSGTPPNMMNGSNPDFGGGTMGMGGFGDAGSPSPVANMTSSVSRCLQPLLSCIIVVASIVVLDI